MVEAAGLIVETIEDNLYEFISDNALGATC